MSFNATVSRICRWASIGFFVAYLLALGVFMVGTYGLFGAERDPLAGVFLIPLGIPWIYVFDRPDFSEPGRLWLGLLAPLVNLVIIAGVCRFVRRG